MSWEGKTDPTASRTPTKSGQWLHVPTAPNLRRYNVDTYTNSGLVVPQYVTQYAWLVHPNSTRICQALSRSSIIGKQTNTRCSKPVTLYNQWPDLCHCTYATTLSQKSSLVANVNMLSKQGCFDKNSSLVALSKKPHVKTQYKLKHTTHAHWEDSPAYVNEGSIILPYNSN